MDEDVKKPDEQAKAVVLDKKQMQAQLKSAIRKIQARRREIFKMQGAGTPSTYTYKTGGHFKMNENDTNVININTHMNAIYLLKALAMLNRVEREYELQAELLGLQTYPKCQWLEKPIDDWRQDITHQLMQVCYGDELRALTDSEAKLKAFLSEEDRLAAVLRDIGNLFKRGKIKESGIEIEDDTEGVWETNG